MEDDATEQAGPSRRSFVFGAGSVLSAFAVPDLLKRYVGGGVAPVPDEAPRGGQLLSLVDLFIGTAGRAGDELGNTLPGAQVPFGLVSASPDTVHAGSAGYRAGQRIIGFSQTHVSGTGGGGTYGNFRLTPTVGAPRLDDLSSPVSDEAAAPGHYSVLLTRDQIRVRLAASRRVAMHRYTFPRTTAARVVVDAASMTFDPASGAPRYPHQKPVTSQVHVRSRDRVDGSVKVTGGYNFAPYTLYFSLVFDRPATSWRTFVGGTLKKTAQQTGHAGQRTGAMLTFDTTKNQNITARIGVSFVSSAQAHRNIHEELPSNSITAAIHKAQAAWIGVLDNITVYGGSPTQQSLLYTSLYRCHVMPHDCTGENIWTRAAVHYEDYYTLWDTFRTVHPLLALLQPGRERDMVQSLVDVYKTTGWLPSARVAGNNGLQQVGTHADTLVTDVLRKRMSGIDYATAYQGMIKNAEQPPPYPVIDGVAVTTVGRPGLSEYLALGYVPLEFHANSRPTYLAKLQASRTVEYAYNDYCIAQAAKALGHDADHQKYLARSSNWATLWDPQTKSIRPRYANGQFVTPFDPAARSATDDSYYEGSGYQYATFVPHDVQGLINRLGGDNGFVTWLDRFFETRGAGYYQQGNEHNHLAAYLYIHAGRPDRTAERVRALLATHYSTAKDGLPGNDDAGAMSAWYVWTSIGLYPNAGQPMYYIGSPVFEHVTLDCPGGKFSIDAAGTSDTNQYVQWATLNGKPLYRAWLRHEEVAKGGRLHLHMGSKPSTWGHANRPPSISSAGVLATAGPADGLSIASDGAGVVSYEVANDTGRRLTVHWSAHATGDVTLSPKSGSLTVAPHSTKAVRVHVAAGIPKSVEAGWCAVSFNARESSGPVVPTASVTVNVAPPGDLAPYYNDIGAVADGQSVRTGFNGAVTLYSATALAAAGISPRKSVKALGIEFRWPDVAPGKPNCVRAAGQTVRLPGQHGATKLGILGSATHGANTGATGTLTIVYTDGTKHHVAVKVSDWTLHGGKAKPLSGEAVVATLPYQNSLAGGRRQTKTYLFAVTVPVDPKKTISKVTLPTGSHGTIGIFALGTNA